jgi:hypothetical protein
MMYKLCRMNVFFSLSFLIFDPRNRDLIDDPVNSRGPFNFHHMLETQQLVVQTTGKIFTCYVSKQEGWMGMWYATLYTVNTTKADHVWFRLAHDSLLLLQVWNLLPDLPYCGLLSF